MKTVSIIILGLGFIVVSSCTKHSGADATPAPQSSNCSDVKFSTTVKPIIEGNCAISGCHVPGGAPGDFTTFSDISSKVQSGVFKARVIDGTPSYMPASGRLPNDQIAKIQCWLDAGAPNN